MIAFLRELTGPQFLLFYGAIIAIALGFCWWRLQAADPTASLPNLALSSEPDAFEIAYLRGGEREVIRLAIAVLL